MSTRTRLFTLFLFLCVAFLTAMDLWKDYRPKESYFHLTLEALIFLFSFSGFFYLLSEYRKSRQLNRELGQNLEQAKEDLERWKAESKQWISKLSASIDHQFELWKMTPAEKEIGLLLLKGLSFKEIAEVRKTSERTVRQQALEIYRKSHLSGRASFAAFFLEDLLSPVEELKE